MRLAKKLIRRIRENMGGYDNWQGTVKPKLEQFPQQEWAIQCGAARYDGTVKTAAIARGSNQAALNFQIRGKAEEVTSFTFSVGWLRQPGWLLMFHYDPLRESWPHHPKFHLQFEADADCGAPPFKAWRIPLGVDEQSPELIHEFLVHQILLEDERALTSAPTYER